MIPAIDQHIVDAGFAQFTERDFLRTAAPRWQVIDLDWPSSVNQKVFL
jgi:hypothetical protein